MPRASRRDEPGALHHVYHRAIARRPAFEGRGDMRFFLSRLAREVHRGELEVEAHAILATHFHLLVRSLLGSLSACMGRILSAYVRRFNRERKRDGSLFCPRFKSSRVATKAYRNVLFSYIDDNPVKAGMVRQAEEYPWGSAMWYARREGPIWLARGWAESEVKEMSGSAEYQPFDYFRRFPTRVSPGIRELVERRLERRGLGGDDLDDLVSAAPEEVRDWMIRKAALADGTEPGLPVLSALVVRDLVEELSDAAGPWHTTLCRRRCDAWELACIGLLRHGAGLRVDEIAISLGLHPSSVRRRMASYRRALEHDEYFAVRTAQILKTALHRLLH